MALLRTFVAIEIPETIKAKLGVLQAELKHTGSKLSWVKPNNIHLTLKFLGDTEESLIDKIICQLEKAAKDSEPFDVRIENIGAFPNLKRPRVIWVGAETVTNDLTELVGRINENLSKFGFEADRKKFSPHLTLGRVRDSRGVDEVVKKIMEKDSFAAGVFKVNKISFIKSQLTNQGAIYTVLKEIAFN